MKLSLPSSITLRATIALDAHGFIPTWHARCEELFHSYKDRTSPHSAAWSESKRTGRLKHALTTRLSTMSNISVQPSRTALRCPRVRVSSLSAKRRCSMLCQKLSSVEWPYAQHTLVDFTPSRTPPKLSPAYCSCSLASQDPDSRFASGSHS